MATPFLSARRDQLAAAAWRHARRYGYNLSAQGRDIADADADRDFCYRQARRKLATSAADALFPVLAGNPNLDPATPVPYVRTAAAEDAAVWIPVSEGNAYLVQEGVQVRVTDRRTGDYWQGHVTRNDPGGLLRVYVTGTYWAGKSARLDATDAQSFPFRFGERYSFHVLAASWVLAALDRARTNHASRLLADRALFTSAAGCDDIPQRNGVVRDWAASFPRRSRYWIPGDNAQGGRLARFTRADLVALARVHRRTARALAEYGNRVGICGEDDAALDGADAHENTARDLLTAARLLAR